MHKKSSKIKDNQIAFPRAFATNGEQLSEEPRNDRPLGRGRAPLDGRDEASRGNAVWLSLRLVLHRFYRNINARSALSWRCSSKGGLSFVNIKLGRTSAVLALFLLVLATSAILVPIYNNVSVTEAATSAVNSTLTLNVSNATAGIDLLVKSSDGTFATSSDSDKASFSVSTTNYTGYTLSISASDDNGKLSNPNDTNSSSNYLSSINAATSTFNSTDYNGKWGYLPSKYQSGNNIVSNTGSNAVYLPSPTTSATTLDETSSSNSNANEYTIGIGARATYAQPIGTYSNTFILTAIANKINYSITYNANAGSDTVTNMPSTQAGETSATNITLSSNTPLRTGYTFKGWCTASTSDESCSGTAYQPSDTYYIDQTTINAVTFYAMWEKNIVNVGNMQGLSSAKCTTDAAYATDNRDGTVYTIQRLADGNCWLLDNLALDLVTYKNVLSSSNTNATDAQLAYLKNGGGTTSDQYATGGVINWPSGTTNNYSYSVPYQQTSYKDTTGTGGYAAGKYGAYYNYCAASAGTYCYGNNISSAGSPSGNATADICPNGWRMPTGGSGGEYETLYDKYRTYNAFVAALHTPLAGRYYNGATNLQGLYGNFWSSTYYDAGNMYRLMISASVVNSANDNGRTTGFSVRCILDERTYMQDLTNASIAALLPNEHSTATVYDKRDGQDYTIAKLKDGKYWMTKNLNLAGGTVIESTLSDVPDNYTLSTSNGFQSGNRLPVSSTSGFSNATAAYVYNSNSTVCANNSPCYSYYSYAAATAGSGNNVSTQNAIATYSICPKGWRLPTSRSNTSPASDFYNLAVAYGMSGSVMGESTTNFYSQAGPGTVPNFPMAGTQSNNSFAGGGSNANYWSSAANGSPNAYKLNYTTTYISSVSGEARYYGLSVRCLFEGSLQDGMYMQDVTSGMVNKMSTGQTVTMKDSRDEQEYTVGKLADGNLWLLDNLALDLVANKDKLNSSNTNATDTQLGYLKNGGRSSGNQYPTSGVINWPDGTSNNWSYSAPYQKTGYETTTGSGGYTAGKYGVYYNYCAASAGTYCYGNGTSYDSSSGNASADICPKGWRMPTGGNSGEYQALYNKYGNYSSFVAVLHTPLSGYYLNESARDRGSNGYFWSSTHPSANNMYSLNLNTSLVYPADYNNRHLGIPVRCVLK